jgi:hypothetical protein
MDSRRMETECDLGREREGGREGEGEQARRAEMGGMEISRRIRKEV